MESSAMAGPLACLEIRDSYLISPVQTDCEGEVDSGDKVTVPYLMGGEIKVTVPYLPSGERF